MGRACGLSKEHESIILNGKWLTDKVTIAAQGLIKKAYPHVLGFQNTNLGETLTFNASLTYWALSLDNCINNWLYRWYCECI